MSLNKTLPVTCWYCGNLVSIDSEGLIPKHNHRMSPCWRSGRAVDELPSNDWFSRYGYSGPQLLANGQVVALQQMIATWGLMVGINGDGNYDHRFCYPNLIEAGKALVFWDGSGDPPGPWLKQKGMNIDRINPVLEAKTEAAFKGVAIRARK